MNFSRVSRILSVAAITLGLAGSLACGGKEYVRGSNDPSIDNAAMSTGLDKEDIQGMLRTCLNDMKEAPIMQYWKSKPGQETVAVFPFLNDTTEHVDSQLNAALSETEEWLVNSQVVTVISRERQEQMIKEVERTQNAAFNPAKMGEYGRQLGAKFYITGKVQAADERTDEARRVQYFLNMQVIEVSTSAIKWQKKAYVTKALR
jgi:PBP1b-binding outer membrane lipoprotein LpoB